MPCFVRSSRDSAFLAIFGSPNAAASTELNRHGTDWALRRDEGALFAGEIGLRFNQPPPEEPSATHTTADAMAPAMASGMPAAPVVRRRGLAGSYKVGLLWHTDNFADIYEIFNVVRM